MIALWKLLEGDWADVRGYVYEDLAHLEAAINQLVGQTFDQYGHLLSGAITGDATQATRYIANTGLRNGPKWDQIDLSNGVKNRLVYAHLATLADSTLLGRGNVGVGDPQQIAIGSGLTMMGSTLAATVIPMVNNPDPDIFTHPFMGAL